MNKIIKYTKEKIDVGLTGLYYGQLSNDGISNRLNVLVNELCNYNFYTTYTLKVKDNSQGKLIIKSKLSRQKIMLVLQKFFKNELILKENYKFLKIFH